jgi:multicomponent Na+:H+ antiporter subunit F
MVQTLVYVGVLPCLAAAMVLAFVRVVRGPDLPDRVAALDLLGALGIAALSAYTLATGHSAYLDVGVVVGLIGFLGTVAFARYIERGV